MGFYTIREPKYYSSFKCIGGGCEQNCCMHWGNIIWTDKEYDALCALEMSDELRETVNAAFVRVDNPTSEKHEPAWNLKVVDKRCPFLTKENLCLLQKTFGEEVLSFTCSIYPRVSLYNNSVLTRACSLSCPEICKFIYGDESAMDIVSRQVQVKGNTVQLNIPIDTPETLKKYPALKYRNIIFDFFYTLLSEKELSVEEALIIGGLAAKILSGYETEERADEIPELLKDLRKQVGTPEQLERIKKIEPNYRVKVALMGTLFEIITAGHNIQQVMGSLFVDGGLNIDRYELGKRQVEEYFKGREYFFRNLALNIMFEMKFPQYKKDRSIFENWQYFCSIYSMSRLLMCAASLYGDVGIEYILSSLSSFNRIYAHTPPLCYKALDFLKEHNCDKSAHIALMLK